MNTLARPNLNRLRLIGIALAGLVFVIDQWVKKLMIGHFRLQQRAVVDLLPFFDLRWTENRGVSLGLLTADSMEMRWLLLALTCGIALVVLVWLLRERAMADIAALALVLGGALGNIRDRWTHGYVIDYADLHFGEFRPFLIFNIADAAITIGVLIILARSFLSREKRGSNDNPAAQAAPES